MSPSEAVERSPRWVVCAAAGSPCVHQECYAPPGLLWGPCFHTPPHPPTQPTPHPPAFPGRGGGLDLSALSIVSGKTCWVVYVDVLLLNIGGNLHDAAAAATKVGPAGRAARHLAPGWLQSPAGRGGVRVGGGGLAAQQDAAMAAA